MHFIAKKKKQKQNVKKKELLWGGESTKYDVICCYGSLRFSVGYMM